MSDLIGPTSYGGLLPFMEEEDEDDKPKSKNFSFEIGTTSAGNEAIVVAASDAENLQITGQGGTQVVDIRGELTGGRIDLGGGSDQIVAQHGSVTNGVEIALGDGNDSLTQQTGSVFRDVDVLGQDGSDQLAFAGHNEGTYIDPGRNKEQPDVTIMHDTVTGNFDIEDPENWTVKPKDETEWGKDQLILAGDWSGRDSERYNTNLFGGGGVKAYSGFERQSGGQVAATINVKGDPTAIEHVALIDEHGREIDTLQTIEPEYEFENMWVKYSGQALVFAGSVIPGAQVLIPIGLGMQTAFELDNKIASWETTGLNVVQGAADLSGVGWLSRGTSVGIGAYRGDYGGAAMNVAGFLPEGSTFRRGVEIGGTGYRSYQAAERGDIPGAIFTATTIPGIAGGDSSGWIARGGTIAGNAYGLGDAIADGDADRILQHVTALPNAVGIDDDRTIMAIGNYAQGAYQLGTHEFGRQGSDLLGNILDVSVGANSQSSGIVQDVVQGNKNLAYRAPPEFEIDADNRLVAKDPQEVADYLDYIDKFRTPEGFDAGGFVQELQTSNTSPRDKEVVILLVEQRLQQPDPTATPSASPELPAGYVLIEAINPNSGQIEPVAVPEDRLDESIEQLRARGFEPVDRDDDDDDAPLQGGAVQTDAEAPVTFERFDEGAPIGIDNTTELDFAEMPDGISGSN